MTDENVQASEAPEIVAAESSLENALNQIKGKISTEEPKVEVESIEEPREEVAEEKRETLRLPEKEKKESKFVETDEPEVQRRINELYKDSKTSKERATLLEDELMRIAEQAERREQFLLAEIQKTQNRFTQQDDEAALSDLRKQYNEAIQSFDYENAAKINEKIVDFKTEQKLNAILKEKNAENNQKQKQVKKTPVYSDPQDEVDANRFASEKASDGSLTRPWLQPNHPQFQDVVDMMAAISNSYIRKNQRPSISAVMQKVDGFMGLGNQKGSPNREQTPSLKHPPVLSSNTTLNASSDNQANKLSDLEKSYAAKLGVSEDKYARVRRISSSGPISMDSFKK